MSRRLIALSFGLAFVAGLWFLLDPPESAHNIKAVATSSSGGDALDQNPIVEPMFEPHFQLPDSGRMSVEHSELPGGDKVILGLPLAIDSIGDTPLAVRVVAVDGRVIDVLATQAPGNQPSVTLSLDPTWLTQGSYMIQLETKEKSALPLRRYVLIIN